MPAVEVLRRATRASETLQSARYSLIAEMSGGVAPMAGRADVRMDGILQGGGRETQFALRVDAMVDTDGQESRMHAEGDVFLEWGGDTSVFLRSLEMPGSDPEAESALLGSWWKIASANGGAPPAAVTADPRLLRAQSEVVRVTRERGTATLRGRTAYRYDVTLDPDKLATFLNAAAEARGQVPDAAALRAQLAAYDASGELWIDTETFHVHRVVWRIAPRSGADGIALRMTADVRDHDVAPAITPPADAKPVDPALLPSGVSMFGVPVAGASHSSSSAR